MFDNYITIVGNVVAAPTLRHTAAGVPVTSFRIASTSRRFDRRTEGWADGDKLFATVNCWRGQAENVCTSLRTGDPVVAFGRIYTREYTAGEVVRASYEVDAEAVGPDLTRGVSAFTRRREGSVAAVADRSGVPADLSAEFGPGSAAESAGAESAGAESAVAESAVAESAGIDLVTRELASAS